MTGPLFESLATLSVRVAAQVHGARVGHLRTNRGDHEIDLIVEGTDGQVVGIEVKLATSVDDADVRHLLWLRDQLPDDVVDLVVLTTGSAAPTASRWSRWLSWGLDTIQRPPHRPFIDYRG